MNTDAVRDEHIDDTLEQSSESYDVPPELYAILRNKQRLGKKHPDYPKGIAVLLELFHQHEWSVSRVANCVNMSTASLSKLVVADPKLREAVNKSRQRQGMRPLR